MKITRETLGVAAAVAIFLIWKFTHLTFRFGDENVYFYMTHAIRQGFIPYKNFNLADPPAFIYLLTGFATLIGRHFLLFKLWPPLFDAGNAVLIYLLLKKLGVRLAALGPALYLFSFTILSTSDYVTGAETAVFCMLLAILLDLNQRPIWSGVLWALACLSKLYIAPALVAYLGYKLVKQEAGAWRTIVAGALTGTAVLLPFFLIASHQTLANLIVYQLHRPAGLDKWTVLALFLQMEWALLALALAGIVVAKDRRLAWPLAASALFLLWFKDLYYLYLHLLLPFLAIFAVLSIERVVAYKKEAAVWLGVVIVAVMANSAFTYAHVYAAQGIFSDPREVASALPQGKPVYGMQEIAPLVALMADKPIFQNVIDTNTQNFLSGALNKKDISDDAVKHGITLVTRSDYQPTLTPEAFKSCAIYKTLTEVAIYRCGS